MKKLLPVLLAVLLLSACTLSSAEITPTPEPTPAVEVTPTPEETATALPWSSSWSDLRWLLTQDGMLFYPFVYTEEEGWAWAREMIGDCSSLVPGYLYLQDLRTKDLAQILAEPVDMFCSDGTVLYCLVESSSVLRTDYFGEDQTTLYITQYGNLASLEFWDGVLLFSDGDHVIRLDVETEQWEDLGVYEGITAIYLAEDGTFTWANAEGVEYARDENGHDEIVPPWGCYDEPEIVEEGS